MTLINQLAKKWGVSPPPRNAYNGIDLEYLWELEESIATQQKLKESDKNDLIMAKSSIDRGMNNTPYFDELSELDNYRYRFLKANINQHINNASNQSRHIVNYCKAILDNGVLNYSYNLKTGSNVNYGVK